MNPTKNMHSQTTITTTFYNPATGRIDYSFVFAFRTREEYLVFRRFWKENYAALSATIRSRKELVKCTMRRREHAGKLQIELHELKREATTQLLMLAAAKQEANRQYRTAKWLPPIL